MKKSFLFSILPFLVLALNLKSQVLTHGPVFGAVTESSAKIFVRTSSQDTVTLELDTDSLFPSAMLFTGVTDSLKDTSAIIPVSGLSSDQVYYCRVSINGNPQGPISHFKTFPPPGTSGNYTFAFGSCLRAGFTDSIFLEVEQHDPSFFLEIGDWGYPDSTDNLPNDPSFFPEFYENVMASYRWRYRPGIVADFLRKTPADYVYDDHDYMNDNTSATSGSYSVVNFPYTDLYEFPNPPGARRNSIKGYSEFFPAYTLPDTSQGIFHSFKFGNAEIFVTDNRSSRSPNNEVFEFTGGLFAPWEFNPPAGHTIIGESQMKWLQNGLANSTADWKFIATGTVFNQAYTEVINLLLQIQLVQLPDVGSGASLASSTADSWGGFPADAAALINFCQDNNIRNVILLSGDSHNSAIDDGSNAGFPEIMSGNLAITNSRTAFLMDSLLNIDVWSEGGQGLNGNSNFNNCFGRVQIFGNDSVRLCAIDQFGAEVVCLTVPDGGFISGQGSNGFQLKNNLLSIYPNPAQNSVHIEWKENSPSSPEIFILSTEGKVLRKFSGDSMVNGELEVSTQDIPSGTYLIRVESGNTRALKPLVVSR